MPRGRPRAKAEGPHKNFILKLRTERDLTQVQLGEMTGIGWRSIGKLERGETRLNQYHQEKIAKALGVSIRDLTPAEGAQDHDAPLPLELEGEVNRLTTEFTLAMGDRLQAGRPIDPTERNRLISDAASWLRAALAQVGKRGGRT